MREFRIQNYKKIEDSGWIPTGRLTSFVGKNESGKSALFRALSKLNPSDRETYNGLKEFPRSRYASEFKKKDWPVASVKFTLEEKDTKDLSDCVKKQTTMILTKTYGGKYCSQFEPGLNSTKILKKEYLKNIQSWYDTIKKTIAPDGKGQDFEPLKNSLLSQLQHHIDSLKTQDLDDLDSSIIRSVDNLLNSTINEEWIDVKLGTLKEESQKCIDRIDEDQTIKTDVDYLIRAIPQFIYFDKYDILYGSVNLHDFNSKYAEKPNDPKLRITKCLFEHVQIDIGDLINRLNISDTAERNKALGQIKLERHAMMDSAGQEMTKQFREWWPPKRKHTIHYDIDHQEFTVYVSDDIDASHIELEERSQGLQYFFSFFLRFLVESKQTHKNSIILLDEPGLYYHGTAQQKTVEFLKKLSDSNQLLYTTHSPFMIDGAHLENVRIVYENKKDKTMVTSDVWPNDAEAVFPLQAGLGYTIAQTLFYAPRNLVVEGITDYLILQSMNELLIRKRMNKLDESIVIAPAGGTKNISYLSSLFISQNIKIFVLLDGDDAGKISKKNLSEKMLINATLVSDFNDVENAEIEDLFEQAIYLKAVSIAYPSSNLEFNDEEDRIPNIVKKITSLFDRQTKTFEKWKVTYKLIELIQKIENNSISNDTCTRFEKIFDRVNKDLV